MSNKLNSEDVVGAECRFAVYCPPPYGSHDDMHFVKERIHKKDGSSENNVRMIKNMKTPFWVTQKGFQNHQQKKEWEDLDKLHRYDSTRHELVWNAAKALQQPWFKGHLRDLAKSPYLYGADILSTATLKQKYIDKYPELQTPYSVACFDTETDVVKGTDQILMATLSCKSEVCTVIQKSFVSGHADVEARLQELLLKYLGDYVAKRGIKWKITFVDDEVSVVRDCFQAAHQIKPDFVAIWNINFDMPKMLTALEKSGVDPKDVFSDPSVPPRYRHFKYKQGPNKKVTASGLVTPIKPSAQWHTVYCPSSFYFIDAMCAYRHIRTGAAERPSYALDAILQEHLGVRKLSFDFADKYTGLEWHQYMQTNHPLEYIIYNVFDCVSMEELDEVTSDLQTTLPMMSGCSDFENFKSQPRRVADQLHYFCLKSKNKVIGTTSSKMADEMDAMTLGLDGWIVTLPAHQVVDNGLQMIEEMPDMRTNVRVHNGDLDVAASYPNGGCVFNVSKETTKSELCRIKGVTEQMQRMQGINLSGGATNSVEFACGMFGLPALDELLAGFNKPDVPVEPLIATSIRSA